MKLNKLMKQDGISASELERYLDENNYEVITAWQYACCKYYYLKYGEAECKKITAAL